MCFLDLYALLVVALVVVETGSSFSEMVRPIVSEKNDSASTTFGSKVFGCLEPEMYSLTSKTRQRLFS